MQILVAYFSTLQGHTLFLIEDILWHLQKAENQKVKKGKKEQ